MNKIIHLFISICFDFISESCLSQNKAVGTTMHVETFMENNLIPHDMKLFDEAFHKCVIV